MADAQGVSVRTLRNWMRLDPAAETRRPGRPSVPLEVWDELRARVRAVIDEQGWGVGEQTVVHVLPGVRVSRVRRVLRELKAEHARHLRELRALNRTSTRVLLRDAVWGLDATHLGRDGDQRAILGEVVRELCSTRTIGLPVVPAASEPEMIELLERTALERGTLPLVLATDNAKAYTGARVSAWLDEHGVIHLPNLPRTPQHNAAVEHGLGELKDESQLGKGVRTSCRCALARLERALERVDGHRLRATRGWRTAVQVDRETPPWHASIDRWAFHGEASCAIRAAVGQSSQLLPAPRRHGPDRSGVRCPARAGNCHDSRGAREFMLDCHESLRWAGFAGILEVRLDGAHYSDATCSSLHETGIGFSVSVPFERIPQLKAIVERRRLWWRIDDEWSYFTWSWCPSKESRRSYRCVVYRRRVAKPHQGPIQLDLFEPVERDFEYKVAMTNKNLSGAALLRFHNGRGSQEATFAETKSQLALGYLPSRRQVGNHVYMLCNLIAHALGRELQMRAAPQRTTQNTATRACLWAVERIDTLRKRLM